MERILAEDDLTVAELRLAIALARLLPGWRRTEARLGIRLIRHTARLDGRSFERARQGLVQRGILTFTPGKVGRGHAGLYSFLPWIDEKTAPQRTITRELNVRSGDAQMSAPQRSLIDRSRGKTRNDTCKWNGLDREQLTSRQLSECGCELCTEWAEHHERERLEVPA
jgi:hypothetical protein